MRRLLYPVLSLTLLLGLSLTGWSTLKANAADGKPLIKDIVGQNTFLMGDGSLWYTIQEMSGDVTYHRPGNLVSVGEGEKGNEGVGVATDGTLLEWDYYTQPLAVKGASNVSQASGRYWLKTDGTVWTTEGKVQELSDIALIASYGRSDFAALAKNGDVYYRDSYKQGSIKKLDSFPGAAVKGLAVYDQCVAVLLDSGKAIVYERSNFDDNGKTIPVTVAQDAIDIRYADRKPTQALIVTRKDGSVWETGIYSDRWKMTKSISGLSRIARTSAAKDADHFYAQQDDGSWLYVNGGDIKPVEVPSVSSLKVSISDLKPDVGDILSVDIQETYTNGAKIKVAVRDAAITVKKPHLLQVQPDGKFKVLAVGQTEVVITSNGVTQTVTVSASLRSNLKFAKQSGGTVFLPAKAVIQALGGTISSADGMLEAKIADTTLAFKSGDVNAKINGEAITLKAAPISDKSDTLIPASLLTDSLGAVVQWNDKWKQADVSFGEAKMSVVSAETAAIVKRSQQGSLAKYIGKTYWINYFQYWDRFSKVTVTDIVPNDSGEFTVLFKTTGGKTLQSYSMTASSVTQVLTNEMNFFTYDPYKKYNWSSSIWKQIKAGQVSLGMTTEQVILSWGYPSGKSTTSASGKKIETWVYSNFDTVSFVNGKAAFILS